MRTFKGAKVAVLAVGIGVWTVFTYACSTEDENPGSTRNRSDGGTGDGSTTTQGEPDAEIVAQLCDKYGGYEKIKSIADGIITRASQDCRIQGAFTDAQNNDGLAHLKECFEIQLGGALGCSGVSYTGGTTKDSKGDECRTMTKAHQDLPDGHHIRDADYKAFVEAASAEFAAQGITDPNDLKSLASFFEGNKTQVVQTNNQPKANSFCTDTTACPTCNPVDAGIADTGTGTDTGTDAGTDAADAGDQ